MLYRSILVLPNFAVGFYTQSVTFILILTLLWVFLRHFCFQVCVWKRDSRYMIGSVKLITTLAQLDYIVLNPRVIIVSVLHD